jgi:tetratricopeptide (TPR) repeat protein
MHAWTRNLAVIAVAGLGLIGCAENKTAKPTARDQITPPGPSQKSTVNAADLPEGKGPDILSRTYLAAGRFHEGQGHLARALEQYQQAVASDPKSLEAWNRLGVVLDRMGRFKEADDAFKKAIAVAPDAAYLHNNLAFSYMTQARWTESEAELNQAVRLKPDFLRARVNLGMVLAQQDKFDEAMTQFETALTPADACYNMGLMYQSKRKLPEAARSFHLALKANPKLVAAQKKLETLPPDAVKAGKEMATAVASPPAKTIAASVAPTTRPASLKATPEVEAVTEVAVAPEPEAAPEANTTPEPEARLEAATGSELQAEPETETTPDLEPALEPVEMPESPVAEPAEMPDSPTESVEPAARATEESDAGEILPQLAKPVHAKPAALAHSNESPSVDIAAVSEGGDFGASEPDAGLTASLLAGATERIGTARAAFSTLATGVRGACRDVVAEIGRADPVRGCGLATAADPYAEFLRMSSPLPRQVWPAAAGERPLTLTPATTAPTE